MKSKSVRKVPHKLQYCGTLPGPILKIIVTLPTEQSDCGI